MKKTKITHTKVEAVSSPYLQVFLNRPVLVTTTVEEQHIDDQGEQTIARVCFVSQIVAMDEHHYYFGRTENNVEMISFFIPIGNVVEVRIHEPDDELMPLPGMEPN